MKTVAELLAEALAAAGARVVFGLPGGENVEILDALRRQSIDFVLVKNESSACMMAAATARLQAVPGVALATLGPGAANAFAGLAHAYLDRAPVLLITAQSDARLLGRHTHQVLDLAAIFRPVAKFTAELDATNAQATIRHALHVLRTGRPGPAHLGVSSRIAATGVHDAPLPEHARTAPIVPADEQIQQAARLLERAQKPLVVVGLGLEPAQPYAALRNFVETSGAALIDTPKSKGALPADHPNFVGTIGLTRTDAAYAVLDDADCIVAVGFDVVELVEPWDQPQPLIWIADWANQDPHIPAACELVGAVGRILESLVSRLQASEQSAWGPLRVAEFREAAAKVTLPPPKPGRLLPQDVLRALRRHTPQTVTITTDVGSHKILAALDWGALTPNRYLVSNGLSVMGFGLVSAIAAARATREPVICITGDAGLAMVVGELALLREYELPVLVVVMNDSALDLIRSAQIRSGKPVHGTEFTNPDYSLVAAGYGLDYYHVSSESECSAAIRSALSGRKPTLIETMIDPISYPTTPRPATESQRP